jgi:hypothetical protein
LRCKWRKRQAGSRATGSCFALCRKSESAIIGFVFEKHPNKLRASTRNRPIRLEHCEVLSEVRIDAYHFKATLAPAFDEACILWFKDERLSQMFEALGRFVRFDREQVLKFIFRYTTNEELREEIERRRFESRLNTLPPAFFIQVACLDEDRKARAYRDLFELDGVTGELALERKRRIMAMKFHPDRGGSPNAMSVVNEAYEFLTNATRS